MNKTVKSSLKRLRSRRGVASALIILLLVLLIFFGVLSLVTAAADLRLSRKRADWNQQYYLADAQAVGLVANLDQYCRTLEPAGLEITRLSALLDNRLASLDTVREHSIVNNGKSLLLTILVVADNSQGQGIELQLRVTAGVLASSGTDRLTVESWTQWQPPFQYDTAGGDVWEG